MHDWDRWDRLYLKTLKDQSDVRAVLKVLKEEHSYSKDDIAQATRVLVACYLGFLEGTDYETHPLTVKRYLTGLANGYGCWLGEIEEAIGKAAIAEDTDRAFLEGAFFMAKQFLFEIEHGGPAGRTGPKSSGRTSASGSCPCRAAGSTISGRRSSA